MYNVKLMKDGSLCEIYQNIEMRFALAEIKGENVKQLHPFVRCRDFLGDTLWATHFKKYYKIYGFEFDGSNKTVQLDTTCMLIEFEDEEKLNNIVRVLHHFELNAKWKRSKLSKLDIKNNDKQVWLVIGSACWMRSPTLVSLYSMLWRLAGIGINEGESVEDFLLRCETSDTNDGRYLKQTRKISEELNLVKHPFYTITRRSYRVFKNAYKYGDSATTSEIHNYHGPIGLMNKVKAHAQGKLDANKFINTWAKNFLDVAKIKKTDGETTKVDTVK